MYSFMHLILHIVQQIHIYLTKITLFSKKSRKTLKKFIFFICVLNFIHILCSRREDKNLYLMCFSQQNATKNNRIAFFFVILLDQGE